MKILLEEEEVANMLLKGYCVENRISHVTASVEFTMVPGSIRAEIEIKEETP